MSLDPNTLETMIIVTSLAMVITLAIVATGRRVPGLWSLAGAALCIALTFFLYAVSGHLRDELVITAVNLTISLTISLLLLAILQLRALRIHPLWVIAPPLIAVGTGPLLWHVHATRFATIDALSAAQGLVTLWALLRNGGIGVGRGRHILVASVATLILLCAIRFVAFVSGLVAQPPPMLTAAPIDTLTYLIIYLIMVFAILGFVLAAAEITADQHHQLAMQDVLTGLPNRRAVLDALAQHWSAAIRAERPLTVLVIDVDHFKRINDQHGHPAGDAVLRRIAKLLRMRVRRQDMVGRFGGEEFLVVLPDTASDSAHALADALRAKIASTPISARGRTLPVTVSIGLYGMIPIEADTIDSLIHKADAALYRAKAAGRNCVISG